MGQIFTCFTDKLFCKEKSYSTSEIIDEYKYIHSYNRHCNYNYDTNYGTCDL